jgi:hypothetical protein
MDFDFWRLLISSCNLFISSPCRVMSSIDFANFSDEFRTVTGMVDAIFYVVCVVVLTPVRGIASSGMTDIGTLCYFSLTNLSSSTSISLIGAFCSIISFNISSLWPSLSSISFGRLLASSPAALMLHMNEPI